MEKQASANALLDVTYSVEEAYFAVHAAKAVLNAAEDAYTRAKSHRDLAKSGVDAGMRSPIELTRADADLARFDAGRIRARAGRSRRRRCSPQRSASPDAALDVAGTPAAPPDLPTLNDAIARAEARDPRILQVLAELRADEERTRAIGAQMRPNVYATASISGRAGGATASSGEALRGDGLTPSIANWDVGLVLSWPLFDPAVRARTEASRAEEEVRRKELAQAKFDEVAAIRRAYVAVVVARDALPALQQSLDAARANFAQADARFRAGLGTAVELADAEAVLADAEIQLALGVFDVARTRASFGRTIAEGNLTMAQLSPITIGITVAVVALVGGGAVVLHHSPSRRRTRSRSRRSRSPSPSWRRRRLRIARQRMYVGRLDPWIAASVGPQFVSAYVDTVLVRPGAVVKRGRSSRRSTAGTRARRSRPSTCRRARSTRSRRRSRTSRRGSRACSTAASSRRTRPSRRAPRARRSRRSSSPRRPS